MLAMFSPSTDAQHRYQTQLATVDKMVATTFRRIEMSDFHDGERPTFEAEARAALHTAACRLSAAAATTEALAVLSVRTSGLANRGATARWELPEMVAKSDTHADLRRIINALAESANTFNMRGIVDTSAATVAIDAAIEVLTPVLA